MRRWIVPAVLGAILLALLPLAVAAATNADIIAILNASVSGLVQLTKLAYCAAGITALC